MAGIPSKSSPSLAIFRYWPSLAGIIFFVLFSATIVRAGPPGGESGLPEGFLWGSFIAAHSVEGNHTNEWTAWEAIPGHISDGSVSGPACNHWELFAEDHQWMKKLNQNSVLVSLEWSKIEPVKGQFDEQAIAHYRSVLESLKTLGIKPIVVLWDYTLPQWMAGYGGLEMPLIIFDFTQYVVKVSQKLGDLVDSWATMNDPVSYANKAFKDATYPPGRSDIAALGKGMVSLFGMHQGAFHALKKNDVTPAYGGNPCDVGIVMAMKHVRPARPEHPIDVSLSRAADGLSGKAFLDGLMQGQLNLPPATPAVGKGKGAPEAPPVTHQVSYDAKTLDFIVVDYKGLEEIKFNVFKPLMIEKTIPAGLTMDDSGQVIYPEGLTSILLSLKKYPVTLFVMAGIADSTGARRGAFLVDHIRQIRAAVAQGCNVAGFFYKSLLSGFEFEKGFSIKRGLLDVNTKIQERTPAGGADIFAGLAKSNGSSETPVKLGKTSSRKPKKSK